MSIDKKIWERVQELAIAMALEEDKAKERSARLKYFRYMRHLLKKHGENANVLASMADFYQSDTKALPILKRAYQLAEANQEALNRTLIADSIVQRLFSLDYWKPDESRHWLAVLKQNLDSCPDDSAWDTYRRYSEEYRTAFPEACLDNDSE